MGLRVRRVDKMQQNEDNSDDHKIQGPRGARVPEMVVMPHHHIALGVTLNCPSAK